MSLYHFVPCSRTRIGWMPITSERAALLADRPSFPENPISPYQINSPDEENHDLHSEQFARR